MASAPRSPHESWTAGALGALAGTGLLWGLAFATFEIAYFTSSNSAYPVGRGHALLWLLLVVEHTAVAWAAALGVLLTRRLWGAAAPALAAWAGPGLLLLILAVSHYRDRMVLHQRAASDLAVTAAIVVVAAAAILLLARWGARRPARITRGIVTVAGGALLAGAVASFLTVRSPAADEGPAEYVTAEDVGPIEDTGVRVLVVGLDGADWKVLDPLLRRGEMPEMAALAARGVTARLKSVIPTYSPNLWTSVATGKTLEKHGVPSHVYTRLPIGLPSIVHDPRHIHSLTKVLKFDVRMANRAGLLTLGVYGSGNVKVRRLWDILGDFGMRSICLEWYVTHPARAMDGIQVSDRFHLLPPEQLPLAVYPDSLTPVLAPDVVTPDDVRGRILEMVDTEGLDADGRAALETRFREVFDTMRKEMARDMTTRALVDDVFPRVPDWRLACVYYRGMDGSHHMSWKYRDLPGDDLAEFPERRLRTLIDGYYEFCDGLLAKALEKADERTVVITMSDHGWENELYAHANKPDGFFVVAGGPTVPSRERGDITVYDIAPTVLALLGIPVPSDMDGRVAMELFDPAFWDAHPVRTVSSYERPGDAAPAATDETDVADDAVLEQLEALGYVGQ
jgi:predicted AlkP superfamily phosphohydrolase/phosphomutase